MAACMHRRLECQHVCMYEPNTADCQQTPHVCICSLSAGLAGLRKRLHHLLTPLLRLVLAVVTALPNSAAVREQAQTLVQDHTRTLARILHDAASPGIRQAPSALKCSFDPSSLHNARCCSPAAASCPQQVFPASHAALHLHSAGRHAVLGSARCVPQGDAPCTAECTTHRTSCTVVGAGSQAMPSWRKQPWWCSCWLSWRRHATPRLLHLPSCKRLHTASPLASCA